MKSNLAFGRIALCGVAAAAFAFACSSDKSPSGADGGASDSGTGGSGGKAGTGGASTGGKASGGASSGGAAGAGATGAGGKVSAEAGIPDGGDAGAALSLCGGLTGNAQVTCGEYIVEKLDACGDCHTPRLPTGAPDTTKLLAGSPSFADLTGDASDGMGNIPAPNLTQLGASKWTAQDIMDAILDGKRSTAHGGGMFPAMPYTTLHNMAQADAEAIAAFLLSLKPITNSFPAREPIPASFHPEAWPVAPVKLADIPNPVIDKTDPSYADAMLGKYLAAQVGPCLDCHTSRLVDQELDMTKAFGGGEPFVLGQPFGTVVSENITMDPTHGLKNWTPGLIKTLLKTGKTDTGASICPPMPVGPNGAFGGLTDEHALAIGAYITRLPAVDNGPDGGAFPLCLLPSSAVVDAGPVDSGKD